MLLPPISTVAQTYLASLGHYTAAVDGVWGPASRNAAAVWWQRRRRDIVNVAEPAPHLWSSSHPTADDLGVLAAQIYLQERQIYRGRVDGILGPLTLSAAQAWAAVMSPPPLPPPPSNRPGRELTPYSLAKEYLGTREIPGKNHCGVILGWYQRLKIAVTDDETPWCSTFANYCAAETGYERSGKLNARSWLEVGEKIRLQDAKVGCDVLIFERGSSSWQGHVTFYAGGKDGVTVLGLGGNQRDEVNISRYATNRLLGVRRLRTLESLQGSSNKI
jgi:uncharacterized protein (TIGR02594 family)